MGLNERMNERRREVDEWQQWREAADRRASELLGELYREVVGELDQRSGPGAGLFSLSWHWERSLFSKKYKPELSLMSEGWRCGRFFVGTNGSIYAHGGSPYHINKDGVWEALSRELQRYSLFEGDVLDSYAKLSTGVSGSGVSRVDVQGWTNAGVGNHDFLARADTSSLRYSVDGTTSNLLDDLASGLLELTGELDN